VVFYSEFPFVFRDLSPFHASDGLDSQGYINEHVPSTFLRTLIS